MLWGSDGLLWKGKAVVCDGVHGDGGHVKWVHGRRQNVAVGFEAGVCWLIRGDCV